MYIIQFMNGNPVPLSKCQGPGFLELWSHQKDNPTNLLWCWKENEILLETTKFTVFSILQRKTKGQRLASLLGMKQKKKLHNFTAILTRFFVAAAVAAAAKLHSFLCLKNGKNAAFKGKKSHIFLIGHLTCYHTYIFL